MASRGRRRASSYKWKKPDFMKNSRKSLILVIVLVVLFSSWFLYGSHKLQIQNAQSEEKIEYYQTLIEKEEARAEQIAQFEKESQTTKYIEEVARVKFGLVKDKEIIFKAE